MVLIALASNHLKAKSKNSLSYKWIYILSGITQGSILGPLMINILINDLIMFIERSDIFNFAHDNTLVQTCW